MNRQPPASWGILKQLAAGEKILEHVSTAFREAKMELGGGGLRLPDMVQMVIRGLYLSRYLTLIYYFFKKFYHITPYFGDLNVLQSVPFLFLFYYTNSHRRLL